MSDTTILELARQAVSSQERLKPQKDREGLPRVGDIRLARALPSSSTTQRLVLVLQVNELLNHAEVCLLSNERDTASDFDVLLRREETRLPFELVAEMDLVSPMYLIQQTDLFGQIRSKTMIESLQAASSGDFSKIRPSLRGLPIRGRSDPRWVFKEEELSVLQELSRECTSDLVEGRVIARPIIDPALVAEVADSAKADPAQSMGDLISFAESARGGVALPAEISLLIDQLDEHFMADPTFQSAMLPLFEAAISASTESPVDRKIEFLPPRNGRGADEYRFSKLVASIVGPDRASVFPLLTTQSAWAKGLSAKPWVTVDRPGGNPMYGELRDPRRAA